MIPPGAHCGDVTLDAGDSLLGGGISVGLIEFAQDGDRLIFQRPPLSSVLVVGQLADGVVEFELFNR